eukprot:TRINITY_DN33297_c0_g1_i1.p1 TRINITY_DN33297_c0_g1~~TRINITY_DN33297_c0_g1_i1.p1  ORF type:complete len:134 (-),score=9.97 TRINITY_DN33297_c0_g1_i1:23-424(-)
MIFYRQIFSIFFQYSNYSLKILYFLAFLQETLSSFFQDLSSVLYVLDRFSEQAYFYELVLFEPEQPIFFFSISLLQFTNYYLMFLIYIRIIFSHVLCVDTVSYTHLRAHETRHDLVCRLLLEKKKKQTKKLYN